MWALGSEAHCSSITGSPAVAGAEGVRGVLDVAASETGTAKERRVYSMQEGERRSTMRWLTSKEVCY